MFACRKGLCRRVSPFALLLSFALSGSACVPVECVRDDLTCHLDWLLLRPVSAPVFSPASGRFVSQQSISIVSLTPGAVVHLTTDGSLPTQASTAFAGPLPMWSAAGRTFRAIASRSGLRDSEERMARFAYHVLRTGQVASYASSDDGAAAQGVAVGHTGPTAHATFPSDHTTLDSATGLTWKSCSEGQSGPLCAAGAVASGSLAAATAACSSLNTANGGSGYAAQTNWRVPTMKELLTLGNLSLPGLPIYSGAFPGTAAFAYWSSTSYPANAAFGWYVDYTDGNSYATFNSNNYHVRCVSAPPLSEAEDLSDSADGTIFDNVTGLTWQKCSQGQANDGVCSGAAGGAVSWAAALSYCTNLTLAGQSWRLPNRNELVSIYSFSAAGVSTINTGMFPNASDYYWTSTTAAANTTRAWYVNFNTGFNALTDHRPKADATTKVRCVSGP